MDIDNIKDTGNENIHHKFNNIPPGASHNGVTESKYMFRKLISFSYKVKNIYFQIIIIKLHRYFLN